MRDTALLVPKYLLLFASVCAVLFTFTLLGVLGETGRPPSMLPYLVESVLLPAVIVSIFLGFFLMPSRAVAGLVSFLLISVVSAALLVFGYGFIDRLCPNCAAPDIAFPLEPGRIERLDSGAILFASVDDAGGGEAVDGVAPAPRTLFGIVRLERRSVDPVSADSSPEGLLDVRYYPNGLYDPAADAVSAGADTIPIRPENPTATPLFEPSRFLRRFFSEIAAFTAFLTGLMRTAYRQFAIAALAVCAFSASCVLFSRLSRWKLVNFILTLFMIRAVFALYHLSAGDLMTALFSGVGESGLTEQLPSLVFLFLAGFFVTLDLLFTRREEKR